MLVCVESELMSSAYVKSLMLSGGVGMSDMYTLKSVGERTPPWGTPVLILDLFGGFVVICCVCFPAFGVIRNVFDDCVWDVGVVHLLDEFVNVDCVEGFTHV